MASDWEYTYAVARIRVLETKLLTDADVNTMVGAKDAKAVITYLKDKGWGDVGAGDDPEEILSIEEKKIWDTMHEMHVDFSVFDVLSFPDIYHNLKAAIKDVCLSGDHIGAYISHDTYGRDEMLRIVSRSEIRSESDPRLCGITGRSNKY